MGGNRVFFWDGAWYKLNETIIYNDYEWHIDFIGIDGCVDISRQRKFSGRTKLKTISDLVISVQEE
jgi:hypothetical protein